MGAGGQRLLLLGALLGALCAPPPLGAAPTPAPPPPRRCGPTAPPPPPSPPPPPELPPDCDERTSGPSLGTSLGTSGTPPGTSLGAAPGTPNCSGDVPAADAALVAPGGDIAVEGTEDPSATGDPQDALGHVTEAYGDATTLVAAVPVSPGGDRALVGTTGDVTMEGTAQPGATNCSWDTSGRVPEVPGDATTTVASVPMSPGDDKALVATSGDVAIEGTAQPDVTSDPRDTLGYISEAYGDATSVVATVTTSPGSDKVLVATQGDITMDRTEDPGATGDPRETLGHVTEAYGDATTTVASVPVSSGSDKVLVATSGDITMEGTEDPGATGDPRDTLGHVSEAYGDATTMVATVTTSPGGDKVLVATSGDVTMEVTATPEATGDPRDTLGHLSDVTGDATTTVASVPVSPGGDKALLATSGDVAMEGTEDPGATGDPRGALRCVTEAYGDATTTVAPATTSPGSDKMLVAPGDDVAMEGTAQPGATNCSWDTLGRVPEVPGDATTTVASVPVSSGGDKVLEATSGDIAVEGTEDPSVTGDPRDTLGFITEAYGDATTVVAPVSTSPGSDKVLVATSGDVAMEGTAQPDVTGDPRDSSGHVSEAYGDATTVVAPVTTSPGSDKMLVAPGEDVAMEGTAQPGATNCSWDTLGRVPEVPGDATTTVASVPVSPGCDKALEATSGDVAMEVTEDPSVTSGLGDNLGHVTEAYGDATITMAPLTTSSGGDKVLVATNGDITVEGTEDPGATGDPRDTLGRITEAYGDATTTVASVPVSSGGDKVLVATSGDVAMEGTAQPKATGDPRDTLGHVTEAYGDATTTMASVPVSSGGDKFLVATSADVSMEGTAQPEATSDPRDSLGHVSEAYGDATTMVATVTTSPGGDKVLVATSGDMAMEGTAQPDATGDPRDTLGHVTEAYGDATTTMAAVPVSSGGDKVLVATSADVTMEVTAPPGATNTSGDPQGRAPDVPPGATTPVPNAIMVAPGGDVAVGGPAPPPPCHAHSFPVTAAAPPPPGPPGLSGSAPSSSPLPLLLLLLLPLPLLLP